jgi:copper(I)-binding protein
VNRALRAAAMGMLLCSTVALSACSAGQVNQTSTQLRDKTGPEGTVGDLLLREVQLAYPQSGAYAAGDDAELQAAIVNTGDQPDTLVNITGPDFASVRVTGSPTGTAAAGSSPAGGPTSVAPTTPATGATPAAPTTPATGATPAAPTTPATGAARQIVVQPGETIFLGDNTSTVTLVDLTRPLTAAAAVPVTFTFQRAGQVTIDALVATPSRALPRGDAFPFEPNNKAEEPGNKAGGGNIPNPTQGNG